MTGPAWIVAVLLAAQRAGTVRCAARIASRFTARCPCSPTPCRGRTPRSCARAFVRCQRAPRRTASLSVRSVLRRAGRRSGRHRHRRDCRACGTAGSSSAARPGICAIGYGRLVWGRLDEIQPSDVDQSARTSTRFLLDGRSEARLPVAFVRGRLIASERLVLEGVLVPVFRRAYVRRARRADVAVQSGERRRAPAGVVARRSGAASTSSRRRRWSNLSGGGRASATIGRVDVAAAVYRGFDGFGLVSVRAGSATRPERSRDLSWRSKDGSSSASRASR